MSRILKALAIAIVIYAAMLALGTTLYSTGAIGEGATHNDCVAFQQKIAKREGIDAADVQQSQIKAATQACLETHRLTKWHAFRTEYLEWAAWPAIVVAAIFLLWPAWAATLHNQEQAELEAGSVMDGEPAPGPGGLGSNANGAAGA